MAEDKVTRIISRWQKLNGEKSYWNLLWDDLARLMLPNRGGFTSTQIEGERRTEDIFDGTPMQAARSLANAIGAIMRPEGLPEIKMRAEDESINQVGEAQDWLGDSNERLKEAFDNPKARFRQASSEKDQSIVVFGTGILYIGESRTRTNLVFQSIPVKEAVVFFGDEGNPEGLFQIRKMTIRQLVNKFGEMNLSDRTRQRVKDTPDDKIQVLHAVIPREEALSGAFLAKNLPIADIWIEMDAKHIISEGGFNEFPFIVPRWDTSPGETYGRSPGMIALPDADTLQAMGETILIAGQRAADPPLFAPNDGSFDALNTFPGGISYYDVESATAMRGNPFFPLESGMSLPITRDMQKDVRDQVFAAFFKNILNLPTEGPEMTATEIIARKQELMRETGPVFGRLESDDTAPMVERAFMIKLRAGGFLPIPKVLQGQNIKFEYESPVKRIRQQIDAAAAIKWAQEITEFAASSGKPEALDLINIDALGRYTAQATDVPSVVVNSAENVQAQRQQRQQAQAQQAQVQQIASGADIANTVADAAGKASKAGIIDLKPKGNSPPTQAAA